MKTIFCFLLLGLVGEVAGCGPATRVINYNEPLATICEKNPDLVSLCQAPEPRPAPPDPRSIRDEGR